MRNADEDNPVEGGRGDADAPSPSWRHGPGPELMGASTLIGNHVHNLAGQHIGEIREIMLDTGTGGVGYVVMSFGGFMTLGEKLFALPGGSLQLDTAFKRLTLDVDLPRLERAPGFDKNHWPDKANPGWTCDIRSWSGSARRSHAEV